MAGPVLGQLHTLVYPADTGGIRASLEFSAKAVSSVRHYALDFSAFVADARTSVTKVFVQAGGGLLADGIAWSATTVWLMLGAGTLDNPAPVVTFDVFLANGDVETFDVVQPLVSDGVDLSGTVAVGWQPVTFGGQPVDLSELTTLPGGLLPTDLVFVVRPPATSGGAPTVGLDTVGGLVGTASGYAAFLASLPTTPPAGPGQAWLNGSLVAVTTP